MLCSEADAHADIIDPECNLVYSVKNKRTTVKRTYEVVDPAGAVLFEVRHTPTERDKMSCVFRDATTGKDARIVLRGKFHKGRGDLVLFADGADSGADGVPVAEVRHTVACPNDVVVKDPSTVRVASCIYWSQPSFVLRENDAGTGDAWAGQ